MMLEEGTVEPSTSPWASPIVLVRKKDATYRFCVDFRKLSTVSVKDAYPLPMVSATLDKLRNAHYLSTVDVKPEIWQMTQRVILRLRFQTEVFFNSGGCRLACAMLLQPGKD